MIMCSCENSQEILIPLYFWKAPIALRILALIEYTVLYTEKVYKRNSETIE